jgi:hypothetical protein
MEDAHGEERSTAHSSGLEAAAEEAERDFLAAREAWHAERGGTLPPRERMTGLPKDAPQYVREAERRYLDARDAWWNVRDQWLVSWGREPRSGG